MTSAALPDPTHLDDDQKQRIGAGLKKVVGVFHERGLIDPGITHKHIVRDPAALYTFIQVFRNNREAVGDLLVDADGAPVGDDESLLECGVSLLQIQQLLVRTCAKNYYERETAQPDVVYKKRVTRRFLFMKKTETVATKAPPSADTRKLKLLLRYLAYDWQLPLLPVYAQHLTYQHIAQLDEDILALRDAEAVTALGSFDPATIDKARQVAQDDFINVLLENPAAIGGIARWPRDMYVFFRKLLKDKAFRFFARDSNFFNVVAGLDKAMLRVYGDSLAYVAPETLLEMERLNLDQVDVLMESLRDALGKHAEEVLSHPGFGKDILRKLVESLLHLNYEKDQLRASAELTCKAMAPQMLEWLEKARRQG